MLRSAAAAGLVGVAGCIGGEEGEEEETEETEESDGSGEMTEEDTPEPDAEPVTDTITVRANTLPGDVNFNHWAPSPDWGGLGSWFQDLQEPYNQVTGDYYQSGHTWEIDGREISVPTLVANVEIDPPLNYTYEFDDRFTYWNGERIGAEAYHYHHKMGYLVEGDQLDDEVEYEWSEMLAEDRVRYQISEDEAQSELGFRQWITPAWSPPLPPEFTRPYVEQLEDVTTEEEHTEVVDELSGRSIDLYDMMENGWGGGPYQLESEDDIGEEAIVAHLRDDHPASDNITIPNLRIELAEADRYDFLLSEGEIDAFNGIVQEEGGQYNRQTLPDHIQEVERFLNDEGDQLIFNWQNKHLERLNVRRALVAAIPWQLVGLNGWGPERSLPVDYDTGMLNTGSEAWFGQEEFYPDDYLDQFYEYPIEANEDLATEFMETAGYTMEDGVWVDHEGDPLELDFIYTTDIPEYIPAAQTIHESLQAFGVRSNLINMEYNSWDDRLQARDYDMTLIWSPGGLTPLLYYDNQNGHDWLPMLNGSSGEWLCQPDDEKDTMNRPLTVTIPDEIGALEIEGAQYGAGNEAVYVRDGGHTFNLCEDSRRLWEYGPDRAEIAEIADRCARWYNYALYDYMFHQYTYGIGGNVRDFEWAPEDHLVNAVTGFHSMTQYQIHGGIVQASYDTDYPDP